MPPQSLPRKDFWDKLEIFGKSVAVVIVPAILAVLTWNWNTEKTRRDTAARMTEIALGVLQQDLEAKPTVNALRLWAVEVLQHPSNPPDLTEKAAQQIRQDGLPAMNYSPVSTEVRTGLIVSQALKALEELDRIPAHPPARACRPGDPLNACPVIDP